MTESDLTEFKASLREAAAWCEPRVRLHRPAECLRGDELRYEGAEPGPEEDGAPFHPDQLDSVVQRRRQLLSSAVRPANAEGERDAYGRLLLTAGAWTMFDGMTPWCSAGFFNIWDLPPWETWVWHLWSLPGEWPKARKAFPPYCEDAALRSLLVSWIPNMFAELTEHAIASEQLGIHEWADRLEMPSRKGVMADLAPFVPIWMKVVAKERVLIS